MIKLEWDSTKALKNLRKHELDFEEAITVFSDPLEITIADSDHSIGKYRFLSIGKSKKGKLLIVSYTEPEENSIRIISARLATKNEKKHYEQEI